MKQAGYTKRAPSRSPERHRQSHTKSFNTPSSEGKIRGNPQQFVEKYLTLARDATSLGDPISAENYYQFADHYYRLVMADRLARAPRLEKKVDPKPAPIESLTPAVSGENWLE
jgi:hypothetical protein